MADLVSAGINEILRSMPPKLDKACIFKVPNFLRQVNQKAYEPQVLAIGPYHDHGSDHFKAMEAHKIHYLQMLLNEREENDVSKYVTKMRELEERARQCYAEPVSLGTDDFVKMMLLDGCFIVQLIRMKSDRKLRDPNDFIFKVGSFSNTVCLDMLLVENQLPFFVLWELFSMIEICGQDLFKKKVFELFSIIFPRKQRPIGYWKSIEETHHLLDFKHYCMYHDPTNSYKKMKQSYPPWNLIRCATVLDEAGMKFKMDEGNSLFDIRFGHGTIKIPLVIVEDGTECLFRNLIAFEQLHPYATLHHVTDLIVFMDFLIDTAKDVEILRQHGILQNMLGDNGEVATMFNRLGKQVVVSPDFCYGQVLNQMNEYCDRYRRWNKFIAYLKRNYFNSPWAPLVSVVAAFVLLLLAVLQTLYSILSYTKQDVQQY
ncbi:UPF0481 protein At3g47200-like [Durio zibethinus]|uniref:UPF0481 protein At3g47200-like n=1 Tax=Durio zibethinus TaxID=66656 RepID=A0A6P5Y5A9_DURZI|nr:UPF0481 protein At3g47200-like [Durio zibethinus]